jgi:hypothetical protein
MRGEPATTCAFTHTEETEGISHAVGVTLAEEVLGFRAYFFLVASTDTEKGK